MKARYPGTCSACGQRFPKGTQIVKTHEAWAHYTCPKDTESKQLERLQARDAALEEAYLRDRARMLALGQKPETWEEYASKRS